MFLSDLIDSMEPADDEMTYYEDAMRTFMDEKQEETAHFDCF